MSRINADELCVIFGKDLLWKNDRDQMDFKIVTQINDLIRILILDYETFFETEEADRCSEANEIAELARFKRKNLSHIKSINCLEESTNRKVIWSGDSNGAIRIWTADEMKLVNSIETSNSRILAIKAIGKDMWCASEKSLEVRDERGNLKLTDSSPTFSLTHIKDTRELWASCEGKIKIWDISKMTVVKELLFPPGARYCTCLKQIGDNVWSAFSDKTGVIRVWSTKTKQIIKEITGHLRKTNDIVEAAKDTVWTCSDDKTIIVWNGKTFEPIKTLRRHKGNVYALMFTGVHVWSGSWDKSIIVWDAKKLVPIVQFSDYQTDAVSVFLPHYNHIQESWAVWAGNYDHSLNIWEMPACELDVPEESKDITPPSFVDSQAISVLAASRSGGGLMLNSRRRVSTLHNTSTILASMTGGGDSSGGDAAALLKWEISMEDIKDKGATLGTGSFGTVYKAKLFGKEVAVKQLFAQKMDEKTLEEFKKEVSIMSTLRHPHILLFMGACCQTGNLLIVTEVMPLGSVHDIIRDKNIALPFRRKMLFAKDAAMGVNWLHCFTPQFLHLDLKAANLLVDHKWTVKVADFGLSVVKKKEHTDKKQKHGPIGTPLWMAPEVLMNKEYDEKADVYSFGIVMFEILTGTDPWEDIQSLVDLVDAVCIEKRRPPLPQDIPTSLKTLIHSLWHPEPSERPKFKDIVPSFDEVIIDGLLRETAARQFWRTHFLGRDKILWAEFVKALCTEIRVQHSSKIDDDLRFKCMKSILGKKEDRNEGIVTIEAFSALLKWFGPLQDEMLERIVTLLKQPYFFGDISAKDAEAMLAKQKKGTFLLRFSTREPGSYAVSASTGQSSVPVTHYRIQRLGDRAYIVHGRPQNEKKDSIDSLLKANAKQFDLKNPATGSPYFAIIYGHQNNVQTVGYQEVDL